MSLSQVKVHKVDMTSYIMKIESTASTNKRKNEEVSTEEASPSHNNSNNALFSMVSQAHQKETQYYLDTHMCLLHTK